MDVSKGRTRERREQWIMQVTMKMPGTLLGQGWKKSIQNKGPQVCICREYDSKSIGEHMQAPGQWE